MHSEFSLHEFAIYYKSAWQYEKKGNVEAQFQNRGPVRFSFIEFQTKCPMGA